MLLVPGPHLALLTLLTRVRVGRSGNLTFGGGWSWGHWSDSVVEWTPHLACTVSDVPLGSWVSGNSSLCFRCSICKQGEVKAYLM